MASITDLVYERDNESWRCDADTTVPMDLLSAGGEMTADQDVVRVLREQGDILVDFGPRWSAYDFGESGVVNGMVPFVIRPTDGYSRMLRFSDEIWPEGIESLELCVLHGADGIYVSQRTGGLPLGVWRTAGGGYDCKPNMTRYDLEVGPTIGPEAAGWATRFRTEYYPVTSDTLVVEMHGQPLWLAGGLVNGDMPFSTPFGADKLVFSEHDWPDIDSIQLCAYPHPSLRGFFGE